MKLPKLDLPKHSTTLPISGKKVDYRPYTVKEEKIIMLASASNDSDDLERAAMQVVENCASVDLLKLHPVDVEWLYLKLYAASVSKTTEVEFEIDCETQPDEDEDGNLRMCPEAIKVKVDLEKDIELFGVGILEEMGYKRRGDAWVVPITEDSGVVFNLLSTTKKDQYEVLYDAFVCFYVGEEVTNREEVTLEEFRDWIDDLPRPIADQIDALFDYQPELVVNMVGKCPNCGKEHKRTASGVLDFLG